MRVGRVVLPRYFLFIYLFNLFLETGLHIAGAVLEINMQLRTILTFWLACLHPHHTGMTSLFHYAYCFGWFCDRVLLHSPFWVGPHYEAQAGFGVTYNSLHSPTYAQNFHLRLCVYPHSLPSVFTFLLLLLRQDFTTRLSLNLQRSTYFCLHSAGINDTHVWLYLLIKQNNGIGFCSHSNKNLFYTVFTKSGEQHS